LLARHPKNPILTAEEWPYPVNSVFNPGAARLPSGETLLLCRVEDRRGISHLTAARSRDGVSGWTIDPQPTLAPEPDRFPEEVWGIEDPRLTWVPELDQFAIAYTSYSRGGPGVSLALTSDFRRFERYGVVMPPEDKFVEREPGGRIKMVKNPDYWEKGKPYLDGITFLPLPNDQTRVNALRSGEVDMIGYVPWKDIDALDRDPNLVQFKTPGPYMNLMFFWCKGNAGASLQPHIGHAGRAHPWAAGDTMRLVQRSHNARNVGCQDHRPRHPRHRRGLPPRRAGRPGGRRRHPRGHGPSV
jgi:hypothetical protein